MERNERNRNDKARLLGDGTMRVYMPYYMSRVEYALNRGANNGITGMASVMSLKAAGCLMEVAVLGKVRQYKIGLLYSEQSGEEVWL